MLSFNNGLGCMVQTLDELPSFEEQLVPGCELFLDLETTSFDKKEKSTNPWRKCWILGVAIKVGNSKAYYIPVRHVINNVDVNEVSKWLASIVRQVAELGGCWINHSIKYDAQVLFNDFAIDTLALGLPLHCTLDLAKLIDSDRYNHNLTALSREWLHEEIADLEAALGAYLVNNKDYGLVPADIMAPYACQDVLTVPRLWKYICKQMPEESKEVAKTSSQVVSCLIDVERTGMQIDRTQVAAEGLIALNRMSEIQQELHEILGFVIEPHINKDCYDVLCNKYGLPVLFWNDSTVAGKPPNPSFDKEALKAYKALPGSPVDVLDLMLEFRSLHTFVSLFVGPFRALEKDGVLHSTYKQTVRTGRMACGKPNMQQNSKRSKKLIKANSNVATDGEEMAIISADYSQIEFRIIAHYIRDEAIIKAYIENPFTDFHVWVAEVCKVHRTPAKTVNFLMGYGGGKARLISQLVQIPELVGDIKTQIDAMNLEADAAAELFALLSSQRGLQVYNTYHNTLPGLKTTTKQASSRVYERGYCVNKYGRRRHLNTTGAHRAFNSVCQGTAADLMKERLIALWLWLREHFPEIKIIGIVHDEVVLWGPSRLIDDWLLDCICFILEDIKTELRVPIRTSLGWSTDNWFAAADSAENRLFDRESFRLAFEEKYPKAVATQCPS